jgi:uncharacterized membrane protein
MLNTTLVNINILLDDLLLVGGILIPLLIFTSYIYYRVVEELISDKGRKTFAKYTFYILLAGLYMIVVGYFDDVILENKFGIDKHPVFIYGFIVILILPIILIFLRNAAARSKHRSKSKGT